MYDVLIVGAGPAGSTLARLIGSKYKVLVVDKRFNSVTGSYREKCCGGLLAPDAQKILGKLEVALPREILVGPQIFKVRAIDLQAGLDKYYQRFYINLDRGKFDRWLISLLPPSVEIRFGRRLAGVEPGNAFRVYLQDNKGLEMIECKVLVGADGASSLVRRLLFPHARKPRRYLAIQEWFHATDNMPYYSAIFDSTITDFYSWIIPKEKYLVLGSAVPPGKDTSEKFLKLKEKLNHYGFHLDKCVKRESTAVLRPASCKEILTGKEQTMLIGEAAGLISPSSAEGLSYAFTSALLASKALDNGLFAPAAVYAKLAGSLRSNINRKNLKSSLMYFAPTRRAIMSSGLFTMKSEEI